MDDLWQKLLPWAYALILSLWGGTVQYANRVRNGKKHRWTDLFLDLLVCSFSGLLSFFACNIGEVSGWQMAICVSISAHEGPRAIALMTNLVKSRIPMK